MRQYLVHAIGASAKTGIVPFNAVIHLGDHEHFGPQALLDAQRLLQEQNGGVEVKIVSFQPFELPPTNVSTSNMADIQLNECSTILPPVDSPLLIEVAPGVLLRAVRMTFVERRGDNMHFELDAGGMYVGRPRWTHP